MTRNGDGAVARDIGSGYNPGVHPALATSHVKRPLLGNFLWVP